MHLLKITKHSFTVATSSVFPIFCAPKSGLIFYIENISLPLFAGISGYFFNLVTLYSSQYTLHA